MNGNNSQKEAKLSAVDYAAGIAMLIAIALLAANLVMSNA